MRFVETLLALAHSGAVIDRTREPNATEFRTDRQLGLGTSAHGPPGSPGKGFHMRLSYTAAYAIHALVRMASDDNGLPTKPLDL
jgi:hypothetical protein